MGATATPPFTSMSTVELEHARTALEIKLTSVDVDTRRWILGYIDALLARVADDAVDTT